MWALFNFEIAKTILILFGDYDAEVTPVPIPNTVVKLCSADDTWWEAAWESRSSPEQKEHLHLQVFFFCLINLTWHTAIICLEANII